MLPTILFQIFSQTIALEWEWTHAEDFIGGYTQNVAQKEQFPVRYGSQPGFNLGQHHSIHIPIS